MGIGGGGAQVGGGGVGGEVGVVWRKGVVAARGFGARNEKDQPPEVQMERGCS